MAISHCIKCERPLSDPYAARCPSCSSTTASEPAFPDFDPEAMRKAVDMLKDLPKPFPFPFSMEEWGDIQMDVWDKLHPESPASGTFKRLFGPGGGLETPEQSIFLDHLCFDLERGLRV